VGLEIARRMAIVTADREIRLAREALSAEDPDGARAHAQAAFDADPSSPAALEVLAVVLNDREAWSELAGASERHLALQPTNRYAWLELTRARHERGDRVEAIAAAARCVEVAPRWCMAHWMQAAVLARAGELDAAAAAAARAVECEPFRAREIAQDEDLEPLRGHPGFRELDYLRLLDLARTSDDPEVTRRACLLAIGILPARADAHELLLELAREDQDVEAALAVIDRWQVASPDASAPRYARCELLVDLGRLDEAAREAMDLVEDADAHLAHLQLARVAMRRGDEAEARRQLDLGQVAFDRAPRPGWGWIEDHALRFPELEGLVPDEEA
jgi:tetratricopeptide (TPR) repeat protein